MYVLIYRIFDRRTYYTLKTDTFLTWSQKQCLLFRPRWTRLWWWWRWQWLRVYWVYYHLQGG